MSHRRLFLKQLVAAGAVSGLGRLAAAEELMAAAVERRARAGNLTRASVGSAGERDEGGHGSGLRGGLGRSDLREEYLLAPGITYLNHGSIGTIPRAVHEAHRAYLDVCETNPWLYLWGGAWEDTREAVRALSARVLGTTADRVALTHNTTEGFNLLSQGLPLGPGDEVLFSSLNHPGASVCWHHHGAARGYRVRTFPFPVLEVPELSPRDVVELHVREIRPETRVLVFPHVDNIVGLRHPVADLTHAAREAGVEFVAVDGAQTVGMLPVEVEAAGVDFYAASPHKWLQAPKGLGLLYVSRPAEARLRPMWVTWGQERWAGTVRVFEDYGTRNFPELLALGDAIEFQAATGTTARERAYRELWEEWRGAASAAPRVRWRSPTTWELAASLFALEVEGIPSSELFERLWAEGGFVFRAFRTQGLNTARISPNLITTEEEREAFFAALAALG